LTDRTPASFFARERRRAALGVGLYLCAALITLWQPISWLVLACLLPVFYAATSEGWSPNRPLPRNRNPHDRRAACPVPQLAATSGLGPGRTCSAGMPTIVAGTDQLRRAPRGLDRGTVDGIGERDDRRTWVPTGAQRVPRQHRQTSIKSQAAPSGPHERPASLSGCGAM
jgi:hypothetical protein